MKATGIVRKMDDMGRIVIPKEIRKAMGIRDGQPFEIFTQKLNGKPSIAFQAYDMGERYDYEALGDILKIVTKGEHPFVLSDSDGDEVYRCDVEYPEDQEPTDYTFKVDGFEAGFLTTTAGPISKTLVAVCEAFFNQYIDTMN